MSMSKQDFELISTTFRNLSRSDEYEGSKDILRAAAMLLARDIKISHPRFDEEKFFEACGLQKFWNLVGFTEENADFIWNYEPTVKYPVQEYR